MCVQAGVEQALAPGGAAVGVGVDDQLGPAGERLVGGGVHVAEDQVGLQARFQHPVGATVDGDDQRPHVADVGAQRLQVAPVAVAADDDQHVAVAEDRFGRREVDAAGQQVGLFAHVGDGVLGELGQRLVDPLALFLQLQLQLGFAEDAAAQHLLGRRSAPCRRRCVTRSPSFSSSKGVRPGDVDQPDPGPGQHQRPGVRVGAVGGGRGVDHRGDAGGDQLLGRDPVDVDVVDHGDVARAQAFDQVLGALAEASGPFDRRVGSGPSASSEQGGQATATDGGHAPRLGQPKLDRQGLRLI